MDVKIPKCPNKDEFKLSSLLNSFQFELISPDEVNKHLSQLSSSKACGFENVPNNLYKLITPIISSFLADIFNKSYDVGTFPSILKYAKVIALYKTGPKHLVNNYRPISLLSPIAKVFEKLLYLRLANFFSCKKDINNQQFGFRKGYSPELAITDLHNRIIKNTDNGWLLYLLHIFRLVQSVRHCKPFNPLRKIVCLWYTWYAGDNTQDLVLHPDLTQVINCINIKVCRGFD